MKNGKVEYKCEICDQSLENESWHCDNCGYHVNINLKECHNCKQQRIEFHEVASIFPMMAGQEFDDLKNDIQKNGLFEPIWTHEGKIIDGRNRYRACVLTGAEQKYREWNGRGSLVSFVVSLNLKRRHLSSSQRAVIATAALPLYEAEAKERKKQSGKLFGEKHPKEIDKKIYQPLRAPQAIDNAAKDFGTNRQYISYAKKIEASAPEKLNEIKSGQKSITQIKNELSEKVSDILRRRIQSEEKAKKYFSGDKGAAELALAGIVSGLKMTLKEKNNLKITDSLIAMIDDDFCNIWNQTASFVTMLIKLSAKKRRAEIHNKKEAINA